MECGQTDVGSFALRAAIVTSFALDSEESGVFALGLDSGQIVIAKYAYDISFSGPNNVRSITPKIEYPFGKEPYELEGIDSVAVASHPLKPTL